MEVREVRRRPYLRRTEIEKGLQMREALQAGLSQMQLIIRRDKRLPELVFLNWRLLVSFPGLLLQLETSLVGMPRRKKRHQQLQSFWKLLFRGLSFHWAQGNSRSLKDVEWKDNAVFFFI